MTCNKSEQLRFQLAPRLGVDKKNVLRGLLHWKCRDLILDDPNATEQSIPLEQNKVYAFLCLVPRAPGYQIYRKRSSAIRAKQTDSTLPNP